MLKRYISDLKESPHLRKQFRGGLLFVAGVVVLAMVAGYLFRQTPMVGPAVRMGITSDFPRGTWFNSDEPLSLFDQLRGHIVVILFNDFNTLADLEDMNRLSALDSVFADSPVACVVVCAGRDVAMTDSLISQWNIQCPVLADPDFSAMEVFGVRALPAVIIVDTVSRIAARYYEDWNTIPLEAVIEDLVNQGMVTRTITDTPREFFTPGTLNNQSTE